MNPRRQVVKAILLGDYGVGKTSFFRRTNESDLLIRSTDSWDERMPSLSVDKCSKTVIASNNKPVQIDLWDTAGAERYRTLTLTYYRNVSAVIFMYRTDQPSSLANMRLWIADAKTYIPSDTALVLLGNHVTDKDESVSVREGDAFAASNDITAHIRVSIRSASERELTTVLERVVEEVIKERKSRRYHDFGCNSVCLHDQVNRGSGGDKRLKCC
uniref:Rab-like5 n=1 Tax=Suberites domuncula TaxID=55567 RepID=A1XKT8_SUBDO|nr:Rab-like5 [Suberites domuncula]